MLIAYDNSRRRIEHHKALHHVVEGRIELQVLTAEPSCNLPRTEKNEAPDYERQQDTRARDVEDPVFPTCDSTSYWRGGHNYNWVMGEDVSRNQPVFAIKHAFTSNCTLIRF